MRSSSPSTSQRSMTPASPSTLAAPPKPTALPCAPSHLSPWPSYRPLSSAPSSACPSSTTTPRQLCGWFHLTFGAIGPSPFPSPSAPLCCGSLGPACSHPCLSAAQAPREAMGVCGPSSRCRMTEVGRVSQPRRRRRVLARIRNPSRSRQFEIVSLQLLLSENHIQAIDKYA
ncbi:hypothetical protein B0T22DRAFT_471939 [Podospora appendiculata]|uniref:Uncharacterized protein n=1 Tax=Podospora appendiculata TaxID=314037 RepID=A0AAE1C8F8_9PEZI|nr:hypothetical protein B0T22DRAFT_471939 [Podospora appendiculata]